MLICSPSASCQQLACGWQAENITRLPFYRLQRDATIFPPRNTQENSFRELNSFSSLKLVWPTKYGKHSLVLELQEFHMKIHYMTFTRGREKITRISECSCLFVVLYWFFFFKLDKKTWRKNAENCVVYECAWLAVFRIEQSFHPSEFKKPSLYARTTNCVQTSIWT